MEEPASSPTGTPPPRGASLTGGELHARLREDVLGVDTLQALAGHLDALVPAEEVGAASTDELIRRLVPLSRWIFAAAHGQADERAHRVRVLGRAVDLCATWWRDLSAALTRLIGDADFVPLFEVGLPNDRGLYEETMDRLARGLLPRPRDPRDGRELISALIPDLDDAIWLASIGPELARPLLALAGDVPGRFQPLRRALDDTIVLLATRVSAIGLGRELRERSPACALAASPFYLLPRSCDALFSQVGSSASCFEQVTAAREALRAVLAHLDEYGVSVDVVYRLEVIEQNLDRLVELLTVRDADGPHAGLAFAGRLAVAVIRSRSLRDVVRTNGRLLARKIVERAGTSGEHYITTTRREWRDMLVAGAGGGVVTVGTTALKFAVVAAHLPLFLEGVAASVNYAGSFLVMQLCGFALATKQPSMVAASLAGSLKSARRDVDLTELVDLIARICRSQVAAALGNVVVGALGGVAFTVGWSALFGTPFLGAQKAEATIRSLDPLRSGTVAYASLTGVFLWLASLGAGWLENFFVYRRVAEGVAQHPAGRWLGRERLMRLAIRLHHGISGIGGNVTIGCLLGMMPVLGAFFGLPLEVRHVTLSTVSLAIAVAPYGMVGLARDGIGPAIAGIGIILVCNFGVSFALALWVAMRARGVRNQGVRLLGALGRRFYRSPLDFIRPPRD